MTSSPFGGQNSRTSTAHTLTASLEGKRVNRNLTQCPKSLSTSVERVNIGTRSRALRRRSGRPRSQPLATYSNFSIVKNVSSAAAELLCTAHTNLMRRYHAERYSSRLPAHIRIRSHSSAGSQPATAAALISPRGWRCDTRCAERKGAKWGNFEAHKKAIIWIFENPNGR